ncbi:MAG: HNH endonuclease [Candidatus Neomarinimicrobiota bacterium]
MESTIENLRSGEKLYEQRARKALPVIVWHAINEEKVTYSDLAEEIGIPNPRNLNYVLGCIGSALEELSKEWGETIPPINAIVINKNTDFPSDGIAWFLDKRRFDKFTPEKKKETLMRLFDEVFHYERWTEVLDAFKLDSTDKKVRRPKAVGKDNNVKTDYVEQEKLEEELRGENIDKMRKMLQAVDRAKEVCVEINGKIWKRNNALICLIKKIRGCRCQLCGYTIKTKDGSYYAEGAHIIAKNTGKGRETPNNIIILCPNHHKEFDLGDREIISYTDKILIFKMNGKEYRVDLSIN